MGERETRQRRQANMYKALWIVHLVCVCVCLHATQLDRKKRMAKQERVGKETGLSTDSWRDWCEHVQRKGKEGKDAKKMV